jgi:hypothetical protein
MTRKRKPRPYFRHIYIDWLGANVYWTVCSIGEYSMLIHNTFNLAPDVVDKNGAMRVYESKGAHVIVLWIDRPSIAMMAHEVIHGMTWLLDSRGIEVSRSNDEVLAYMVEYVMKQMSKEWPWKVRP